MYTILRAAMVYVFVLLIVRITGRRTLGEMTTFDFVLVLIIGEATQNMMLGDDMSLTNGYLVILTLVVLDVALSLAKQKWPRLEHWMEGLPTILVKDGRALEDRMARVRVDVEDILEAARKLQGLERMDQIKYAVLERNGGISVVPRARDA